MYNYKKNVCNDVIDYIADVYSADEIIEKMNEIEEFAEELNDHCWNSDNVTGNYSGSYTFDSYLAKKYIMDNFDLFQDAAEEFDIDKAEVGSRLLAGDFEWFDIIIRCYVLSECIWRVLEALREILNDGTEGDIMGELREMVAA